MSLNPFANLRQWLQPRFKAIADAFTAQAGHISAVNTSLHLRLDEISRQISQLKPKRSVRLTVVGFNIKPKRKDSKMLQTQLRTSQYAVVRFKPLDANGDEVGIDGDLKVTTIEGSPAIRTNALELSIIPPDTKGRIEVKVDADGAKGEDVEIISDTIVLDVLPNNAATLGGSIEVRSKKDLPPA